MFYLIADKIEADPSLLRIPLENIERWVANGHRAATKFHEWREVIGQAHASQEGMNQLLWLLRDDSESTRWFKGWDPFPGILTQADRRLFTWTSRH